jgi:hypothetical protein
VRWQTTAVLAVLLTALGVSYYVWEVQLAPEREKAEAGKGRVFSADVSDVQEARLKRGEEVVRLKRAEDGWAVVEPVTSGGDRGTVEAVLTTVTTAKMDRDIADRPSSLAEFGLDKPAAEVLLTVKSGEQLGLSLGAKSPTGVWVYAQERGKPRVFALSDSVLRDVTRPVADFRDKTVLAFERQNVTGLEIATRDETLTVEPAAEGKWTLTRPRALPADADTVRDLLDKLATARVKEFVADAPRSLHPYGLERPLRVTVRVGKDKDRATRTLLLGKVDEKTKGVYAKRPGEPSVLLLPAEIWTALPKHTAALRDKTVVDFERDKVTRIELKSPRGAVTLVKEADRWKIAQPESLPADPVEAGAVLMRLRGLRAQGFLSEDAAGIPRYLARPDVRATLTLEGAPAPLTVLLSPSGETRGGQPMAYAAVAGRGPVVLVEAGALKDIGRSLTELRDRTLVMGLEPRDVKRLTVTRDGRAVVLERTSDTDWRFVEGGKGAAPGTKVDDVLYGLRGLKWKEIVDPRGANLTRFGLDQPTAEIGLYRGDGTATATVLLGKREGDHRYVKTKAAPAVYAIDAKAFEPPKVPDDFQG